MSQATQVSIAAMQHKIFFLGALFNRPHMPSPVEKLGEEDVEVHFGDDLVYKAFSIKGFLSKQKSQMEFFNEHSILEQAREQKLANLAEL
jgi:hypothetical protein